MGPAIMAPPPALSAQPATPSPTTNPNEVYAIMCAQIVKEQALIMGALALEQVGYVAGLSIDPVTYACSISGDGATVVEALINQYRDFFGNAAVEVCKEAAARFMTRLSPEKVPASLR